jgi:alkanesulfonate monooxygenase SsuD/methylene tetrahydromethanopterin reductase-like flavin-dependent oxidoreductase (luciferase family)
MRFGLELAPWGDLADPRALAALARAAEASGWDGLFLWDSMVHDPLGLPKADLSIALAAIAMATERIRFGPMVAALPRHRPWKVAREAVSLDHLSAGRFVLGVGLGDPSLEEFAWFGEAGLDHRTRAAMLDEGLAIVAGLWSGQPFGIQGEHYRLHEMTFLPTPVQKPRIPIWVGGWWPNRGPMRRAARWDGVHPGRLDGPLSAADVAAIVAYIGQERTAPEPFEVVVGDRPTEIDLDAPHDRLRTLAEAGATWWLLTAGAEPAEEIERLVRHGPPR